MYNYLAEMKMDVLQYIQDEINLDEWQGNRDGLQEKLNDDLWDVDSVTGNASGSYTMDTNESMENVTENMELLLEAIEEFCIESETVAKHFLENDWCYFDVTIRCHLLYQAISEALDELEENGLFDLMEEDEEGTENSDTKTA